MGKGTEKVVVQLNNAKPKSRSRGGGRRRGSKKGGRKGTSVEATVDNISRSVAGTQSVAMMTAGPLDAALEADNVKDGVRAGLTALKEQGPEVYLEAQVPRIANSAGIAGRKAIERLGRKVFGGR